MQWIIDNLPLLLTILLIVSEALAAVMQLVFPQNKGVSGVLAAIIKVLQAAGAKEPPKA